MKINFRMSSHDIAFSGIYLSLILIMGFTPYLGFVTIGTNTFALILLPIALASIHYKWKGALLSMMAFGLISFLAGLYMPGTHHLIINNQGLGTWFLIAFGGRMLAGIGVALIALAIRKAPLYIRMLLTAIAVAIFNSFGYIGLMCWLIPTNDFIAIFALKWINFVIEWAIIPFIVMAFYPFFKHFIKK